MKQLATALFAVCFAAPLFAQNARTFVSGTGLDTGSTCGASAPCRSFAYALGVTNGGGDIVALDSAGYGTVSITKAVNIIVPPGILGAITVPGSGVGVTVNAGSLDIVRIQGVHINTGGVSTTGLRTAGVCCKRIELKNVEITGVSTGIDLPVDTRMSAENLKISDFGTALYAHGGTNAATTTMKVYLLLPVIEGGTIGLKFDEGALYTYNGAAAYITIPYQYANETFVSGCTPTNPFTLAIYNGNGSDSRNGINSWDYTACQSP